MYVGVLFHVALLMEPLAAKLARVRPRVGMYKQVGTKCARPFECFTALLALEHLLRRMHRSVLRQTYLVPERFVAQLTCKRPLSIVRPPGVNLTKTIFHSEF